MIAPVIKWSGSKRRVAHQLSKLVPAHTRYYEPFLGGGALVAQVRPVAGVISDVLPELMSMWKMIRDDPHTLAEGYTTHWRNLQAIGHTYFYDVRDEFNKTRNPVALLFLSRTCVNGLIRFNASGEFNNSLHHTRPGINPDALFKIIMQWSRYVANLEMAACDYAEPLSTARSGDFVFLDPPYAGNKGRYMPEKFDYERFSQTLGELTDRGARWMLTLDGVAGKRDYEASLPPIPAKYKFTVNTGHSPFTRLMNTSLDNVSETVYLNFDPAS